MKYLILAFVVFGLRAEPAGDCSLCIGHHGTCGCDLGHVVCCDGFDAYGCGCK